jgi:hypothetical protein
MKRLARSRSLLSHTFQNGRGGGQTRKQTRLTQDDPNSEFWPPRRMIARCRIWLCGCCATTSPRPSPSAVPADP